MQVTIHFILTFFLFFNLIFTNLITELITWRIYILKHDQPTSETQFKWHFTALPEEISKLCTLAANMWRICCLHDVF